jgi:hypothetical protein
MGSERCKGFLVLSPLGPGDNNILPKPCSQQVEDSRSPSSWPERPYQNCLQGLDRFVHFLEM